jgi:hypothetical protein
MFLRLNRIWRYRPKVIDTQLQDARAASHSSATMITAFPSFLPVSTSTRAWHVESRPLYRCSWYLKPHARSISIAVASYAPDTHRTLPAWMSAGTLV